MSPAENGATTTYNHYDAARRHPSCDVCLYECHPRPVNGYVDRLIPVDGQLCPDKIKQWLAAIVEESHLHRVVDVKEVTYGGVTPGKGGANFFRVSLR